ncbi:MAG: carboxypeptidase M32 [Planctomycetota bacterium]
MTTATNAYEGMLKRTREIATLGSVGALLSWDQETYMPSGGGEARAEQGALIAKLRHERATAPELGDLIAQAEGEATEDLAKANVREAKRTYDKATKLPGDLVEELARTGSRAQDAWKGARADSDFKSFEPWLDTMMSLTRRKAECLFDSSGGGELYDALLDEYEPGATAAEVQSVFDPLRERLSGLIKDIADNGTPPDTTPLDIAVDEAKQHELGLFILGAMTFDLDAGRLDVTTHPFCSGLAPGDTRLTTRYKGERWTDSLYGTMHEAGHGLYEQGLPKSDRFGEPIANDTGLGTHESQSRMWENFVGRSAAFWSWFKPHLDRIAGPGLEQYSAQDLYRATNTAKPSYIRVEADEATYNLHVMLRFELERALLRGELSVADLPGAWNERFESMLGLQVPDDRRGCLQDVHWSFGLVGYFPTYTLGNLYAAQYWETIREQFPDLDGQIGRGELGPLREWLRDQIHTHGKVYRAAELCDRITGKPLASDPLLRHLEGKLRPIYGV